MSEDLIERAAKVIDPEAFGERDNIYRDKDYLTDRDEARARAKAVIALMADELAAERKTSAAHLQRRQDIAVECNCLRAELAAERDMARKTYLNLEADYQRCLAARDKLRELLREASALPPNDWPVALRERIYAALNNGTPSDDGA